MKRREKRILDLWFILLLLFNAFSLVSLVFIGNVWAVLLSLTVLGVDLYWYYVRRVKGKKPRYPLATPEGRADVYLPRTDIPRPVIADFREIEEKKRRMAKIKKLQSKVERRKKK
ncbi:MAG: hypothetical protein ACPL0C_04160 [Candidatus Bathyarchaeales archaeon]